MPWFFGWNIVATSMLTLALIFGSIQYVFTFWVESWMNEFDASRAEIMMSIMLAQMVSSLSSVFVGRAVDHYPIRWILMTGIVCCAVGFILVSMTTAMWQITMIYASVMAAAFALAGPISNQALAARWFRRRRGLAIGMVSIGTSIGAFTLPPMVTLLLTEFDWRQIHLMLAAGILVILLPLVYFMISNSPHDKKVEPEEDAVVLDNGIDIPPTHELTTAAILKNRNFVVMVIVFLFPSFALGGVLVNLGPLASDLGFKPSTAALFMSTIAISMIGGKVFFGALADKYDHRKLVWTSIALMMIGSLLMTEGPGLYRFALASFALGFGGGSVLPLMGAMVAQIFGPDAFGRVLGLLFTFMVAASASGPIAGYIRDVTGQYDAVLYLFLLGFAVAFVAMAFLPQKERVAALAE